MQPQISSAKPYCELATKQPIFETPQSCVSTMVTLSHRFKSSPAIPGKVAVPGVAGYLMMAGHFHQNIVSSGDLNRPRESRGPQPSACFCGTFCTPQKVPKTVPFREVRGSANLDSAHPNYKIARTKLKPSQRGLRGFANIDSARRDGGVPLTKIIPLPLPRAFSAALGGIFRPLRGNSYFL